ncbi:hypothetical protein AB4S96_004100 [Vibrio vulnificus]
MLYFAYLFTRTSLNRWLNQANKKYKQRISHCLGPTGHNQGYGVRAASQVLSDLG